MIMNMKKETLGTPLCDQALKIKRSNAIAQGGDRDILLNYISNYTCPLFSTLTSETRLGPVCIGQ